MLGRAAALLATACLASPAASGSVDNGYAFDGGTPAQRQTVAAALAASSFDWQLVPGRITIHIRHGVPSTSTPREIWLDADLLDAGQFAWGVVQHEYAHQVDYLLFDDAARARLRQQLGGLDWCYSVPGLRHSDYGCERFASTFAWSFWPSSANCMRPSARGDESAAMAPTAFRALIAQLTSPQVERVNTARRH
jgi:hypothetical protein